MCDRIRIATWNLDLQAEPDQPTSQAIRQLIQQVNAHVWVLTESMTTFAPGADYSLVSHSQAIRKEFVSFRRISSVVWDI
jgi:hypothetical protein